MDAPLISVEELAGGGAHTPVLGPDGELLDPLIFVDLTGDPSPAVLASAVEQARSRDRMLIGYCGERRPPAELIPFLDLTLVGDPAFAGPMCVLVADAEAVLHGLQAAVTANPVASFALATVLRMTERLPVAEALDAESFAYSTLLGGPEFAAWLGTRGPRTLPPEAENPVLVERDAKTLHVTLNRPERRNAYGRQLRDALVEALQIAVLDDTVQRIVLDGAGPVFSSGGDLAEFGTASDPVSAHLIRTRAGAGRLLHALRARLEVHVHGTCVGAGVELPAFAGTVTAAPGTTFRLPEVAMGLIPGAGGTVGIPRRIGRWRTVYLALSGEAITAPTAAGWGLVDRIAGPPTASR